MQLETVRRIKKAIFNAFPVTEGKIEGEGKQETIKFHVKEVNDLQIRVLAKLTKFVFVKLKRSGTGITILVSEI